jgi:hypothetical protein
MPTQLQLIDVPQAPPRAARREASTAQAAQPDRELAALAEAFVRSTCDNPNTRRNYLAYLLKAFVTMRTSRLEEITLARQCLLAAPKAPPSGDRQERQPSPPIGPGRSLRFSCGWSQDNV